MTKMCREGRANTKARDMVGYATGGHTQARFQRKPRGSKSAMENGGIVGEGQVATDASILLGYDGT
jgi:hypothetical protein